MKTGHLFLKKMVCVVLLATGALNGLLMLPAAAEPTNESVLYTARISEAGEAGDGDFELFLNVGDGPPRRLTNNDMDDCDPHWRGGKIVFERGNWDWDEPSWQIWMLDPVTGEEQLIVERPADSCYVYNPKISPDGTKVLYWTYWRDRDPSQTAHILDVKDGVSRSAGLPLEADPYARWTPDGNIIFVHDGDDGDAICTLDVASGAVKTLIPPLWGVSRVDPTMSLDGRRVAYQESDYEANTRGIYVFETTSGSIALVAEASEGYTEEMDPEWGVNGQAIYCTAETPDGVVVCRVDLADSSRSVVAAPESDWIGVPAAAEFTGLNPGLELLAEASGDDWVSVRAVPRGLLAPVEYTWALASGTQWCDLDSQADSAALVFRLPSPVTVRVVALGAAGRQVTATLEVAAPAALAGQPE